MNPKDKGTLIEQLCIVKMLELGHHVSIPIGESMPYDFILDFHGQLFKIQCKAPALEDSDKFTLIFEKNVSTRTQLRTTRYLPGEVDFFATVAKSICYLIPYREGIGSMNIRTGMPKNFQAANINWAVNYEADYILSKLLDPSVLPRIDMEEEYRRYVEANTKCVDKHNSQYGTRWITDGKVNKKICQSDELPEGFRFGRVM